MTAQRLHANLPWRRFELAKTARQDAARAKQAEEALRLESAAKAAKENSFYSRFIRDKIVPTVLAIFAFLGGQFTEQIKQRDADERIAVAARKRLFESTAQEMGAYVTHWNRLVVVSGALAGVHEQLDDLRWKLRNRQGPSTERDRQRMQWHIEREIVNEELVRNRRERYVKARDEAKDHLTGNFEQARLFFREKTIEAIKALEAHENGKSIQPDSQWKVITSEILNQMREEIRNDELDLRPPLFAFMRDRNSGTIADHRK